MDNGIQITEPENGQYLIFGGYSQSMTWSCTEDGLALYFRDPQGLLLLDWKDVGLVLGFMP